MLFSRIGCWNNEKNWYLLLIGYVHVPIELIFFKNCYLWQESRVWKWLLLPQLGSWDLKLTFFLIPFLVKQRTLVSVPDIASLGERKAIFPSLRILGSFSLLSSLRKSISLWENACCMSSLHACQVCSPGFKLTFK